MNDRASGGDTPAIEDILAQVKVTLKEQGRLVLCQVVRVEGSTPAAVGWRLLLRPDGTRLGNLGGGAFEALVERDGRRLLVDDGPTVAKRYYLTEEAVRGEATGMVCGGMLEVLLESIQSRPVLIVGGGGPVGQSVAAVGHLSGFAVVVVEDRDEFQDEKLYPAGVSFLKAEPGFRAVDLSSFRGRDLYLASVSRCWTTDTAILKAALGSGLEFKYIGLMGSKRKVQRVREDLAAAGFEVPKLEFFAPIGIAIGSSTPGEIAVSILAEIIRTRRLGSDS